MTTTNYRIEVFSFYGEEVSVVPNGEVLRLSGELDRYVEEKWAPKREKKWKSSWIPLVSEINYHLGKFTIKAGAMTYAQTHGMLEAIKEGKSFTPKISDIPCIHNLSIGILPKIVDPETGETSLLVSQRDKGLNHAPGVWNCRGGYMTSLLFDKANCDKPEYAQDKRLFDIHEQVRLRIEKQEFKDLGDKVELAPYPVALAFGFYHSLEMELGLVGTFRMSKEEMLEKARQHEVVKGQKEHSREMFVPANDLEKLLVNQGDLLKEDPRNYETDDPTNIILLDCNIGELVGGGFEAITGSKLDSSVVKHLIKKGLSITLWKHFKDKNTWTKPVYWDTNPLLIFSS